MKNIMLKSWIHIVRTILDTIEGCFKNMDVRFGQKLGQIPELSLLLASIGAKLIGLHGGLQVDK